MHLPTFKYSLGAIGVVGLSILAVTYILHSGSSDNGPVTSAHEKELQLEIDQLHKTIDSLTADLNHMNMNPQQLAVTAANSNQASSESGMVKKASAPPASSMMITPTHALMGAVNPTPEQSAFFQNMKQRFDDPTFVRTLNLSKLAKMEEILALPGPMQEVLLDKAIDKYQRGEVSEQTFLTGMAGYPR